MFDHSKDPNEWTNLIESTAYKSVRGELSELVPDKMTPLGSWYAPSEAVEEHNQRGLH